MSAPERAFDLLVELTSISSSSGDTAGIRRALDRLAAALDLPGRVDTADLGRPDAPVLLAGDLDAERPLLVVGHVDTVLPACEPRRDGDRLVATGAIDMKGGLAAFAGALFELAERGAAPPEGMLLAVVPDEEIAGPVSTRVVRALGARARALWVLEPGERRGDGETLVVGRRGLTSFSLRFKGASAHAGNAFASGRSALLAAADWSCRAARAGERAGEATLNIGRLVAGDATFVEHLDRHHDMAGTEKQINVVPDRAIADGEARYLAAETGAALIGELERLAATVAAEHGVEARFEPAPAIPPLEPTAARRSYGERAVRLAARRGWTLTLEDDRGGISFPNFLPGGSEVPVLDGLGPAGGGMHTRQEWLSVRSLERRIGLIADLLVDASATR